MKYTIEITKDGMVKTFTDDEGKEYTEIWQVKGPGHTGTLGPCIVSQMEDTEEFDDELLNALESEDLDDIWQVIRNS